MKNKIYVLTEEPKNVNTKLKQILYRFTSIIAKVFDYFNFEKHNEIQRRRYKIANMNYKDFIETVTEIMFQECLALGPVRNENLCRLYCKMQAAEIFWQKKKQGYFDDLNVMIDE